MAEDMAAYNTIIKKRNAENNGWDSILPVTLAENVLTDEAGGTVASQLASVVKFPTATGTGTAIVISYAPFTYTAGQSFTFVASANNSGSATTIAVNGASTVSLYKPNTTDTPNIVSGKAYTVWYDGTDFFLKASAEGDAVAANVLAGKKFSNDDDTGIVGTMPNRTSTQLATLNPGVQNYIYMYPPEGYYNGSIMVYSGYITDYIPNNILTGKNIYGVIGIAKRRASGNVSAISQNTMWTINCGFQPKQVSIQFTYNARTGYHIRDFEWNVSGQLQYNGVSAVNPTSSGFGIQVQDYMTGGATNITWVASEQ